MGKWNTHTHAHTHTCNPAHISIHTASNNTQICLFQTLHTHTYKYTRSKHYTHTNTHIQALQTLNAHTRTHRHPTKLKTNSRHVSAELKSTWESDISVCH